MPYVETPDGVTLHYTDQGSGPVLLLLHGWCMGGELWWRRNVPALAETHRVVVLDFRGHGLSGKGDEGHTLAQYARDVRLLLEALDPGPVTPVGWSMGTSVLLRYVEQFGCEGFRSVVLVDQSPRDLLAPDWPFAVNGRLTPEALAGMAQSLRHDRKATLRGIIRSMFAVAPPEELVDEMYAQAMLTPGGAALAILMDLVYADLRHVVPAVTVPALLVYGAQSHVFPGAVGTWLAEQLPSARLCMFEASGHCPFWEEPERFNAEVAAFVAR